jgi:hypothetical protein
MAWAAMVKTSHPKITSHRRRMANSAIRFTGTAEQMQPPAQSELSDPISGRADSRQLTLGLNGATRPSHFSSREPASHRW